VVFEEFENFRDFQDGQIDQHTSDLGGNLFTSDVLDKGEQQFTQNLSLSINIQSQEFRKLGSQVVDSKSGSVLSNSGSSNLLLLMSFALFVSLVILDFSLSASVSISGSSLLAGTSGMSLTTSEGRSEVIHGHHGRIRLLESSVGEGERHALEDVHIHHTGLHSSSSLSVQVFISSFSGLVEGDESISSFNIEGTDFGDGRGFHLGLLGIIGVFKSDETRSGLLLAISLSPVLDSSAGDLTEMSEGLLEVSFSDFGLQVLDEKVGFVAGDGVVSLEFTESFSTSLVPVGIQGAFSTVEGLGVVIDVGESLLGSFFILEADESREFAFGGVLLDELGFDFTVFAKDVINQLVDFSFSLVKGEVLNIDVSSGSGGGSSVLGNEGRELEFTFSKSAVLEDLESVFSVFLLFELDITISQVLSFRVGGNSSADDGANLREVVVEVLNGNVRAKVLDEDVGISREVSDVSLEHNSNVFSAELFILSILSGRVSISGIDEVDETKTTGFAGSGVSHDSDEMDRSELGEEIV